MAGFLDLSPISMAVISNKSILILPLRHTQGPQGCQNIHKNISKMNLVSHGPSNQAKSEIIPEKPQKCPKNDNFSCK